MTSQDATMGGGMQGPVYEPPAPTPESPTSGFYHAGTQRIMQEAMQSRFGNMPDVGPAVEAVIQRYPLMSRDVITGLVVSDQINTISPALLDALAEKDMLAQKQAEQQGFWQKMYSGVKAGSRHFMIGAEDLYNASPIFTVPRTIINKDQGKSWAESAGVAFNSTAANHIMLTRLGFEVGYGEGWMPSDEIVATDPYFYATVKEKIVDGDFEGSTEEQIIAASQEAMYEQAQLTGINPYAMAVEQWNSTHIYRTIGGVDYSVPYSPGAAVLLPVTTPGTRSYDFFSGLVDGVMRITMEPIDIPLDEAGKMIRGMLNPAVRGGIPGYRQRAHADVMHDLTGVETALEPTIIKHDGFTTVAKGATYPQMDEAGEFRKIVDPDKTDDHYDLRMDRMHKDNAWDLEGEYAVYTQPYEDMGVRPSQVRNELSSRGGRQAEFYLTVEHELHHGTQNKTWFGHSVGPDGQAYVDYAKVTDTAPDDIKAAVANLTHEANSIETVNRFAAEGQGLGKQIDDLSARATELQRKVDTKEIDTVAGRKQARREIDEIKKQQATIEQRSVAKKDQLDAATVEHNTALTELQDMMESYAIKTAWNNMLDGSWQGEKIWKAYKRKAGLSKLLRPYVAPKSVHDWLQSRVGKRTLSHLARLSDIEALRKRMPYIEGADLVRIAETSDEAVIQGIIQDAFEGNKVSRIQRPTVGVFTDKMTRGMDAWQATTRFVGGPVGRSMTSMGVYGSRLKTSIGNNLLSMTDLDQTLDTINSVLATVGATRAEINKVQRMAILGHGRHTTINGLYDEIQAISTKKIVEHGRGLYDEADVTKMWNDWRGYEITNQHYWTSNAGKDRNWIFSNGRFKTLSDLDAGDVKPEAFMEAQFSQTNRSIPQIRTFRRLTTRQRNGYEQAMRWKNNRPKNVKGWDPKGFESTGIMNFGDVSFGIWRDLQLMRGGWMLRIIPEEQLRFGASGMSNIFRHPLDYFISMLNPMDFSINPESMTLGDILRKQESLGTGSLRDMRFPPHMVRGESWDVANRTRNPEQFWGGLTHEYVMSSTDPVVSRVARMGRDEAYAFFKTDEGKKVLAEIADQAAVGGSLARVIRPEELERYLDVVELRVAQITGGDGLWHNPETGQWVDSMDQAVPKASDTVAYPNEDALHRAMVDAAGGDMEVLVGMSHKPRADLEAALNELRGYNLDELELKNRSAVVTRNGDDGLRRLVGERELDDFKIDLEMSYDEMRNLDKQLEGAFNSRNVEPPESWPVAKGELDDPSQSSFRNKVTDGFFHMFNAIPSNVLNRQPYFQQKFGAKIAEAYFYGDSNLRKVIDEFAAGNDSFKITFDLGQRQVFRELDATKWPDPFDAIKRRPKEIQVDASQVPQWVYDEAAASGRYDLIPTKKDSMKSWHTNFVSQTPAKHRRAATAERYGIDPKDLEKMILNKQQVKSSHLLDQVDEAVRDDFIEEVEALRYFDRISHTLEGQNLDIATRHAKVLGYDETRWPRTIGDPAATPMATHQQAVQGGMYDRVPLQDDPEGFTTAALMEGMAELGAVEAEEMWTKGLHLGRMDRTSKPYAGFPNIVFAATSGKRPVGEWLETYGRISKGHYESVSRRYGVHSNVVEDLVQSVDNVRTDDIIGELDPIVIDKFVDEIEGMRVIRDWDIDLESVPSNILEDAAYKLGWNRDRGTGGYASDLERTEKYGPYVDVFTKDQFDPHLQRHMEAEGDLEQIITIDPERHPVLAAMEGDIVAAFNTVRNETRFKNVLPTHRKVAAGNKKAQKFFDSLEELGESLPPQVEVPTTGTWKERHPPTQADRIDPIIAWIDRGYMNGGDEWWAEFYGHYKESFWLSNAPMAGTGYTRLNAEGMAKQLVTIFDDVDVLKTRSIPNPHRRIMIEHEYGRAMTDDEWFALLQAVDIRDYQPEEVLLAYNRVEAAGRLPQATMQGILDYGATVKTAREAGNFALYLEANTLPVVTSDIDTPLFRDEFRAHLPRGADESKRWNEWQKFIDEDMNVDVFNEVTATGKTLTFDGGVLIGYSADGVEEFTMDFPTWMASPQFRAFAHDTQRRSAQLHDDFNKLYMESHAAGELDVMAGSDEFVELIIAFTEMEDARTFIDQGGRGPRRMESMPSRSTLDERIDDALGFYTGEPSLFFMDSQTLRNNLTETIHHYQKGATSLSISTPSGDMGGFSLGNRMPTPEAARGEIVNDFHQVPQVDRNAAAQRMFNAPIDKTIYDQMEAGSPASYSKSSPREVNELEQLMMAAKRDSIDETKDLFYDLTNKSNVADALKFIFPFGDAWYEVLSRWAKIQNPIISGGQSFRNVRRVQQTINAGRQSGFIHTNEYGEEVFNWPINAGSVINHFIPNGANVSLQSTVPISSLMFIDPSARGIMAPGVTPAVQLATQFMQPDTMNIPLFKETMSWLTYGGKQEYRPGEIDDALDVAEGFLPTVYNRLISAAFNEQSREVMGNTKLRIFESIGIAGDPDYNIMANPANAAKAWDVANTTGSWLGWLRILDSWWMPGQPQFTPIMEYEDAVRPDGSMTLNELLAESAKLGPETQVRVESIVRATSEYRRARDLFGDAEADMYMIERYGILPSMLQSASVGLVDRPTTWGGVQHIEDNEWLKDVAPLTLAWTVPPDADPTFSSAAWNNLFSEHLELEGVENQPIRKRRSPSEMLQSIQRGMGYDQVRFQNAQHDQAVEQLRDKYGQGFANDPSYRAQKNQLDRIHRDNVEGIYTEFPIVSPSMQGAVVGSPQSIPTERYMQEIITIGTPGSEANQAFREGLPELADVAEQYAAWFTKMEQFSRLMDDGKASGDWWTNSTSPNAMLLQAALAKEVQIFYQGLPIDSHAQEYAKKLNERLFDPLLKDWEWVNSSWSFETEAYPSLEYQSQFGPEETP